MLTNKIITAYIAYGMKQCSWLANTLGTNIFVDNFNSGQATVFKVGLRFLNYSFAFLNDTIQKLLDPRAAILRIEEYECS